MADQIKIISEINSIDSHGDNIINKLASEWDLVQDKPILRPFMLGQVVEFPRRLTLIEEENYKLLPMDGRELENVDPYRQLYALLCNYGDGPFPVILDNSSQFQYIQYGGDGDVWDGPPLILSLQTAGVAFTAKITANFDSGVQPQDMIGRIDWPDGTNTQISADGIFNKSIDASVGIINIFGNMTQLVINNSFSGSILGGDTSKLTSTHAMFAWCSNITGSIPNFNTSNVKDMNGMFYQCSKLTGSMPDFDMTKVKDTYAMFQSCVNLTGSIPNFNTSNVTDIAQMFYSCRNLTGSIPNFNTSNVTNMGGMFQSCYNLTGSIPNFNTSNVIGITGIFFNCFNLTGSIPNFNTSNVTNTANMFNNCYNLTGSIPNLDTSNVTNMWSMFNNCTNLTGSLPNWDITNVTNMNNMFKNCINLTGYNLFTGTWAQGRGTA